MANTKRDGQRLSAQAVETAMLRSMRIDGSQNGATLRTRVIRDKKKYTRTSKHKKSFADAGDSAFFMGGFPWFVSLQKKLKITLVYF